MTPEERTALDAAVKAGLVLPVCPCCGDSFGSMDPARPQRHKCACGQGIDPDRIIGAVKRAMGYAFHSSTNDPYPTESPSWFVRRRWLTDDGKTIRTHAVFASTELLAMLKAYCAFKESTCN